MTKPNVPTVVKQPAQNAKQKRLWRQMLGNQRTKLTLVNLRDGHQPVFVRIPVDDAGRAYCPPSLNPLKSSRLTHHFRDLKNKILMSCVNPDTIEDMTAKEDKS